MRRVLPKRAALTVAVVVTALGSLAAETAAGDSLPQVRVASVRRIFHNGEHNAFTDLVRFQGKLYLTFRSCPDGHMVHPTASIMILTSDDGREWRPVHRFHVEQRDTRDPHFLVFRDKLFVYTGTWYSGPTTLAREDYDLNKHLGYAAWSGTAPSGTARSCSKARLATTSGVRPRSATRRISAGAQDGFRSRAARRRQAGRVADAGERRRLIWRKCAVFQETAGDETAFLFEPDGSVLAVGRRGGAPAQLLRSSPPYTQWKRKDLDRYVGGPLLTKWGSRYLVGGRNTTKQNGPKTSLCWLAGDQLHEFAELPSGGDNSYPGFVELAPNRALVSYYSSHERDPAGKPITAVYLAELILEK